MTMQKIMKCFKCKEVIPYHNIYENGDFKFLLDEEQKFVGHIENDEIICGKCYIDD